MLRSFSVLSPLLVAAASLAAPVTVQAWTSGLGVGVGEVGWGSILAGFGVDLSRGCTVAA